MPRTARCTTARHAVATGSKNPLVDPRAGAPVASGAMISTTRTPGALTVGPLRPVILQLAAPAVVPGHVAPRRTARVRLLRDRGDVPRLGRHAHAIPSAHGLGSVVGGPRPAAHQRRRSVPEARSRGRRPRLRDGAGWRVPHRYRHRLATRPDTARCPRLTRPAHGVPRGRPALAGGGPALGRG